MLNRLEIIGNLGRDPEVRSTSTGKSVCTFSVACTEKYKKNGEATSKTEWINVQVWDKLAEICGQYLGKGSQVYLSGPVRTSAWDDKNTGAKRYKTELVADKMVMLGGKRNASAGEDEYGSGEDEYDIHRPGAAPAETEDDDIPF